IGIETVEDEPEARLLVREHRVEVVNRELRRLGLRRLCPGHGVILRRRIRAVKGYLPSTLTRGEVLDDEPRAARGMIRTASRPRGGAMAQDVIRPGEAPASDRPWSIETNGINPIPESERHGRPFDLFWVWCGANISILGVTYGAFLLFQGLNLWQAIVAGVIGCVLSFVLVGYVSLAGKLGSAPTLV